MVSPSWRIPLLVHGRQGEGCAKANFDLDPTGPPPQRGGQGTLRRLPTSGGEISTTGVAASGASLARLPRLAASQPRRQLRAVHGIERGGLDRAKAAASIRQSRFRKSPKALASR